MKSLSEFRQACMAIEHIPDRECKCSLVHSTRTIPSTWNRTLKVKIMCRTTSAPQPFNCQAALCCQAAPQNVLQFSSSDSPLLRRHPDAEVHFINMTALTRGGLHSSFWIVDRKHIYIGSAGMDWRSLFKVTKRIERRDAFWCETRTAASPLPTPALPSECSGVARFL